MDYKKVSLETLNGGAVLELFEEEWSRILSNIQDENTDPEAVRELKISIKLKPGKDRASANTLVNVSSKLAAIVPHESFVMFSREKGSLVAFTSDPKQPELDLALEPNIAEFSAKASGGAK